MTSELFRAYATANRARRRALDAWRTDAGRWSDFACEPNVHVWADGGGVYGVVTSGDGAPLVAFGDGFCDATIMRPVTLPDDVRDVIEREYPDCEHMAGAPASDFGLGDGYIYIIHGTAYIGDI